MRTICVPRNFDLRLRQLCQFHRHLISRSVGKEGKIAQRASIGSASGGWAACIDSVNSLIGAVEKLLMVSFNATVDIYKALFAGSTRVDRNCRIAISMWVISRVWARIKGPMKPMKS